MAFLNNKQALNTRSQTKQTCFHLAKHGAILYKLEIHAEDRLESKCFKLYKSHRIASKKNVVYPTVLFYVFCFLPNKKLRVFWTCVISSSGFCVLMKLVLLVVVENRYNVDIHFSAICEKLTRVLLWKKFYTRKKNCSHSHFVVLGFVLRRCNWRRHGQWW